MGSPMAEDGVSDVGLAAGKGKQHIHYHGNFDVDPSHGNFDVTLQFWRDMSGDEGTSSGSESRTCESKDAGTGRHRSKSRKKSIRFCQPRSPVHCKHDMDALNVSMSMNMGSNDDFELVEGGDVRICSVEIDVVTDRNVYDFERVESDSEIGELEGISI